MLHFKVVKLKIKFKYITMKTKDLKIEKPSVTEVENWLQIWKTSDEYEKYRC